jgi:hypothetical protein
MRTSSADLGNQRAQVLDLLERLHRHKDAAYGDAWRKRGEVIAIFANMARKYDRLHVAFDEQRPAANEPLADTVADLCVYAGKYLTWIAEQHGPDLASAGLPLDPSAIAADLGPDALQSVFAAVLAYPSPAPIDIRETWGRLQRAFGELERGIMAQATPGARPDDIPSYAAKARLAWDLVQDATWLLVGLKQNHAGALAELHDEVAKMDEAAARP